MKRSESIILIVPGLGDSDPGHWQSRWGDKLSNATRLQQSDWDNPNKDAWVTRLVRTVEQAPKPVILVAHSLGVTTAVYAANSFPHNKVAGAFLVAPPDVENAASISHLKEEFGAVPMDPLPFPSLLIASRNDPYCDYRRAEDFSYAWGAQIIDAGEAGHINTAAGYGPWPEGIIRFASFMSRL